MALLVVDKHRRRSNGKVDFAGEQFGNWVEAGFALDQFDLQALGAEITLIDRRIIAGELKLMPPFELQTQFFRSLAIGCLLCWGRGGEKNSEKQQSSAE